MFGENQYIFIMKLHIL